MDLDWFKSFHFKKVTKREIVLCCVCMIKRWKEQKQVQNDMIDMIERDRLIYAVKNNFLWALKNGK